MGTDLKFEFKIDMAPVQHRSYRYRMVKIVSEPKLRQYLVLAYQIQEMLDPSTSLMVNPEQSRGIERDPNVTAKKIAGWLNMTPPRIKQLLNLLLLCPAIQKDILLSKDKKLYALGEYHAREIVKEPLWPKQIEMWNSILKSSPSI